MIDEIREDVARLRNEVAELKDTVHRLHRKTRWWRNPSHIVNVVTLIALLLGAIFQMWINRPVVDFQLVPSSYFYTIQFDQLDPFRPNALLFYFEAQNTGQTDITLDITIAAINATVSLGEKGPFGTTATGREFIQARSNWGAYSFYVKVNNKSITSFKVYVQSYRLVDSPDWLTTQVDGFATYNPINTQELAWVVKTGVYPLVYVLQT